MAYPTLLKLASSTTSAPTDQRGREIMFRLVNDGVAGTGHVLSINPEDLQVGFWMDWQQNARPSRCDEHQASIQQLDM